MKVSFGFNPEMNAEAFEVIKSNKNNTLHVFTINTLYVIYPIQADGLQPVMIIKSNKRNLGTKYLSLANIETFFKNELIVMIDLEQNGQQTELWVSEDYRNKRHIRSILNEKEYQMKNKIYDIIEQGIISLRRDEQLVVVYVFDKTVRKNDVILLANGELMVTMHNITSSGVRTGAYEFILEDYIMGLKEQNDFIFRVEKQNIDTKETIDILYSKPNPNVLETVGRNIITPIESQSWPGICVLCYDQDDKSPLCQVNCPFKHVFHCKCIDNYFNTHQTNEMFYPEPWQNDLYMGFNQTCPICRNVISEKSVVSSFGKRKISLKEILKDIKYLK